ncbi:MAG TPA: ParB N-terminal domain-containing protein, partial [Bryobacteraceae bacterium]|nr:ParB N-terminal domain-containing protein [Bryobacteraceae bacterium]
MSTLLPLDQIRTDGGTQPRAVIDFETVDDYMDAMSEGVKFPAVDVFFDGTNYWLADGFHRVKAADQAGLDTIVCNVHQGTQDDAQWYSFGANKANGLRRTNDDKQRAVKAALLHPKSKEFSDRKIARHVGVHFNTVSGYRKQSTITKCDSQATLRQGRDGRAIDVSKIGKRRTKPAPPARPMNAPAPAAEPGKATPTSEPDSGDRLASEWIAHLCHACAEIAGCPITAKELAALIRRGNSSKEILKNLESTDEFIRSVLAEA